MHHATIAPFRSERAVEKAAPCERLLLCHADALATSFSFFEQSIVYIESIELCLCGGDVIMPYYKKKERSIYICAAERQRAEDSI